MSDADPAVTAMPRFRIAERIVCVVIAGLLLALTLKYPSATRLHTWPWALLAALYWLIPVALVIVAYASGLRVPWPNRMLATGLGLLVAAAVVSSAASPFPAASLPRAWPTFGGAALFWLLHRWASEPGESGTRVATLGRGVSIIAAAVILVSMAGWSGGQWPLPWGSRNAIPFGHSIYTAGFTVLALPWFVWATGRSGGVVRVVWSAILVVAFVVLAGTSSRGGALAFGVAAGGAALVILLRARWSTRRKLALAVGLLVVASATALVNPRLRALARDRSWSDAATESNRQRSAMLAAGVKLGQARPLIGWGPGSVPLAYPRVRAELDGGVDNVLELHNTPLQIWATLGAAGVASLVFLLAGVIAVAARRLRSTPASAESLAAAASLGGYAIFALTDHQFDLPIISAMAAANLAILTASPGAAPVGRITPRRRSALLVGLASGMALFALPLLRELQARRAYASAVAAGEEGRTSEWQVRIDRAVALAPSDPFYQHQAAGMLLRARDTEKNPDRRGALTRAVIERLEISLRTGAHEELAHFNLGWLNLELERPDAAAAHFVAAAKLVPDKGGVYFGLGLALQAAGRQQGAIRAFALEWISDPLSMSSPAWEIPLLAPLRPAVAVETLRLYEHLRQQYAPAATAEAWARWWLGEAADRAALGSGFSAEARAFAAALARVEASAPVSGDTAWAQAYAAWREPETTSKFQRVAAGDMEFAGALQRRARRHRNSFHAFLTAPTEDEPALLRTYRRQRTGYGVLALHPDGPLFTDAYVVQENRVAAEFATMLLPPKGWLPGRLLLALRPEVLASPKP